MSFTLEPWLGGFRPRRLTPKPYRRVSCIERSVVTHWLSLHDPWPSCGPYDDLLVVQGVATAPEHLEGWRERLKGSPQEARILVGLPKTVLPPGQPRHLVRDYFAYSNYHWFLGGASLVEAGSLARLPRSGFLSRVLETVYPGSPAPLPGTRKPWREVVQALVSNRGRLLVSEADLNSRSPFFQMLHNFSRRQGILAARADGQQLELRVAGEFGEGRKPVAWLSFLLEALYGQENSQGLPLSEVIATLAAPPFGVRGERSHELISLAVSCHLGSVWHELEGSEPACVRGPELSQLLARRRGRLVFRPGTAAEQIFLRSLRQLFRPLVETRGDLALDPWDQTRRDLLQWYAELPAWTRAHRSSYSSQALALLRVCRDAAAHKDGRELFRIVLPEAFRWKEIPMPGEQALFIDQINVARLELEGFLRRFMDRLAVGAYQILVGEGDLATAREWLQKGRRTWLGGFLSGAFEGGTLSPWAEGLLSALRGASAWTLGEGGSQSDLEERWFVQLPRELGLAPVRDWESDGSQLFLARLGRARIELELGQLRDVVDELNGPRRGEAVRGWVRSTLCAGDVPQDVAEEILALVLDDLE